MMDYYKSSDWNVTCDSCGKKLKASHTRHRWDGFIVCDSCWEPRHSHDFIKVRYDKQEVPFSRRPQETFIDVPYTEQACTPLTRTASADFGTADCAIVGNNLGNMNIPIIKPTYHDPYWGNVVLLMRAADDSLTVDATGRTLIPSGSVSISNDATSFGGKSFCFNGGTILTPTSEDYNVHGDYTIEFRMKNPSSGTDFFSNSLNNFFYMTTAYPGYGTTNLSWFDYGAGRVDVSGSALNVTTSLPLPDWNTVAICRTSSLIETFFNGIKIRSVSTSDDSDTTTPRRFSLGYRESLPAYYTAVCLDQIRITKGVVRYTANYTPDNSPFTNY